MQVFVEHAVIPWLWVFIQVTELTEVHKRFRKGMWKYLGSKVFASSDWTHWSSQEI